MLKKIVGAAIAVIALSCSVVSAKAPAIPAPIADELPVEVVLGQQEVGVEVSATNAMAAGGGLLGALIVAGIDNARTKAAEERIIPIRDLLLDYAFNARMEKEIRENLASPGISTAPVFLIRDNALNAIDAANRQEVPGRALVLTPRYSFDNQFQRLSVHLLAQVVDRSVGSNGKPKAVILFNRHYSFQFVPEQLADKPEDNVKVWTAFGAENLRSMLDEGVRQSVAMLVFDLSAEGRAHWADFDRKAQVVLAGNRYPGIQSRAGDGWVWARTGKGFVQALTGYRVAAPLASVPAEAPPAQATSTSTTGGVTP